MFLDPPGVPEHPLFRDVDLSHLSPDCDMILTKVPHRKTEAENHLFAKIAQFTINDNDDNEQVDL